MTQAAIIQALQDGPLTSQEVAEATGMSQATVISTARKLRTQGKLTASAGVPPAAHAGAARPRPDRGCQGGAAQAV